MMQFTKSTVVMLALVSIVCSEQQILVGGGGAISHEQFYPMGNVLWNGLFPVSKAVRIEGTAGYEAVDAVSSATQYFSEKTLPQIGNVGAALYVNKDFHRIRLSSEGAVTPKSNRIAFPTTIEGEDANANVMDEIASVSKASLAVGYDHVHEHTTIGGDVLYHNGWFDRFNVLDSSKLGGFRESDLYYSGDAEVRFLKDGLFIMGGVNGKDDLNPYNRYDWMNSSVGTGTNLIFNKRKTQIYSLAAITNLTGDKIEANGYVVGIGGDANFRLIQKLKGGIYLKGDFELTGRTDAMKNRYGGSVRKAGTIGAVEGGYWITKGSLYPRQCGWVSGNMTLLDDHLDLESSLKNYWSEQSEGYKYYRTDLGLTCAVRPVAESRKLTLKAGGLFKSTKDVPDYKGTASVSDASYITGVEVFAGIESVL